MLLPCSKAAISFATCLRALVLSQWLFILLLWTGGGEAMTSYQIKELRQEAEQMFYHGYDNYMKHAFPEDELRPLSCTPLTRDRANPSHIELNDPLGNYSVTLIDSLSTLAIIASSSSTIGGRNKALAHFQNGVAAVVEQYGDGTNNTGGIGKRARGFDLDSKVQVFETVIRGVGGLLSAHLFAIGELPIRGYFPKASQRWWRREDRGGHGISWPSGFTYNGQLLRLAHDLARRLLPAFITPTGLPYPRVNLRYGVPFYANSPLNNNAETGQCHPTQPPPGELTETCSAGAGSLVLEFTTLSRLSGDLVFEQLAKRAFWAVWDRKSAIGLVGSGIDAESGQWTSAYTGIGAGIDSFYEYAAKASILLSGSPIPPGLDPLPAEGASSNKFTQLVSEERQTAEAFLNTWQASHTSIKHHLYRSDQHIHPHYVQNDLYTGATRAFWLDSLSAFYPGVLAMTGHLEEAVESHLLYTALWNRYSALPERWSTSTGGIEGGLSWWGGRPEFIESTYHIYRATKDPWYLYVGEMVLRDIKRRCWTKCGWSGIQDVKSGDRNDRMESFFLGETAKYLFLLYDPDHPLNTMDSSFVFSTEGHPLLIPRHVTKASPLPKTILAIKSPVQQSPVNSNEDSCHLPPAILPFSLSSTAARADVFHAAKLARLHSMPSRDDLESPLIEYSSDHPSISVSDVRSPSNYTFYPWTLPLELVPHNGTSSKISSRHTFDIAFPATPNVILGPGFLQRVGNGILINSMGGVRLGMIQDVAPHADRNINIEQYRVQAINNILLGKDERIFVTKETASNVVNPLDPNFTRIRDSTMLDLVIDLAPLEGEAAPGLPTETVPDTTNATSPAGSPSLALAGSLDSTSEAASSMKQALNALLQQVASLIGDHPVTEQQTVPTPTQASHRENLPAVLPTGLGAAPLPDFEEAQGPDIHGNPQAPLLWKSIYVADEACERRLPASVPRQHQIIVIRRGGCSFSQKLQSVPTFAPSKSSLQLIIMVSFQDHEDSGKEEGPWALIRPLLEEAQTTSSGLPRHNPIPMIMVGGGDEVYELFTRAVGVGVKRRYSVQAQGIPISNLVIL